jgi:hypothetical protein
VRILRPRNERRTRVLVVVGVAFCLVGSLAWLPADAADRDTTPTAQGIGSERAGEPTFTATKTLTRHLVQEDGTTLDYPSNNVTVTASDTTNLRGRQRVLISWTGAQPSAARASNPFGEAGVNQEYPVMVLQCRGTDDPSLPVEQQVRPETCWTNSVIERSQVARSDLEASWVHDLAADPSQKLPLSISGSTPFPGADVCPGADTPEKYTHLTPFVSAKGQTYVACNPQTLPPEAGVGAAFPPAEIAAYSDEEGNGHVEFEVRSDVENESLGCNDKTPCTIEVIPINGISCDQPMVPQSSSDAACRKTGQYSPGSSNFANQGVDQAVSPTLWWSATNWANRISVPITFGLPPDTCDVLDPRAPTGFYGSELLAQASLQWSPAYCLDKKRFKYQHNVMPDDAGFNLMTTGGGPAALVSSFHKAANTEAPVGYAPTAVTGFAIGYVIDKPENAGELTDLKLTPRLVAKLLTQSYLGSERARAHPGISGNPLGIINDPEFIELNPGLSQIPRESAAALMSLSVSSDIMLQLTDWIAHDRAASDFVDGKKDPWGMVVNPAYKKIRLPRPDWPLKDTYIPPADTDCQRNNPSVYFNQISAPVSNLRTIAQAILDGWPNVQTRCDFDLATSTYKLGRVDRQSYGARFVLGLVSLGDAARYGLRTASMQTKKGTYVAPDDASLAAAVSLSEQRRKKGKPVKGMPFELDQADVRKSGSAYPGTMVVYTAARESELAAADARKVAQFMRTSTTEGQRVGSGNGELPAGFLPIEKTGPTRKLYESAQYVATQVEKQTPLPTEEPSPTGKPSPTADPVLPSSDAGTVPDAPPADAPSDAPAAVPTPTPTPTAAPAPVAMPRTEAVSSDLGHRALPVLVLLGLIGIALTGAMRFFVRPPNRPGS